MCPASIKACSGTTMTAVQSTGWTVSFRTANFMADSWLSWLNRTVSGSESDQLQGFVHPSCNSEDLGPVCAAELPIFLGKAHYKLAIFLSSFPEPEYRHYEVPYMDLWPLF